MTRPRFTPYAAYKDSGVEWLGEIPTHWEVLRLKHLGSLQAGSAITAQEIETNGDFPVFGGNGIRGFTDKFTHDGAFPLVGRQGALCGCVTLAEGRFWASEHAIVVRPTADSDARWLNAVLLAMDLNDYSVSAAQPGLAVDNIGVLEAARPPLLEQRAIATFLDRETARIDALVAKNERLIALLQERRTALITRSVTKGLDPDAPMKNSGVEWLGEIPAHWEVKPFRYCCRVSEGQVPPDDERFREFILIAPNHIESGTGRVLYTETAHEQGVISGKYRVDSGDIIYSKIRPALNKVCVARGDWLCSADMYPIKATTRELTTEYLLNFMLSDPFVRLMRDESMRVAMPKVNRDTLAACPILLPPVAEQRLIEKDIERRTSRIDAMIARVRSAISRLNEFRTALISAAVTGKIDVREPAT